MTNKESIEIPLGAKDSELKGWEYIIPEGMEARIDGNKIILEPKESEDETIRKELIGFIQDEIDSINRLVSGDYDYRDADDIAHQKWCEKVLAWIKKQGEHSQNPYSGVSFTYNGHTWGMCARDNGVEILIDGQLKSRVFADCKVEPKFKVGDTIRLKGSYAEYNITEVSISEGYYKGKGWSLDIIAADDDYELVEQNPADKVEPKFKVGDWVINTITKEVEQVIELTDCEYICSGHLIISFDNQYLLKGWTIQDAKDGDVLSCENGWTCIFKALDNHANTFSSYCFIDNNKWFCNMGSLCHTLDKAYVKAYNGEIHPSTTEQCDLLFQKMKEAGYEWDAEKKELKKVEQNPAWSDEDDEMLKAFLHKIEVCDLLTNKENCWALKKFKSLKERVQLRQKQEWNEDVEAAIRLLKDIAEEQEKDYCPYNANHLRKAAQYLETCRPQNTWRPSDEQMEALDDFIYAKYPNIEKHEAAVKSLYQDLKKL